MTAQELAATHAAAFARDRPWTAAEFSALLAQPATLLCGDARSFLLARLAGDEAEILTLATHPAHRRLGLARDRLAGFLVGATARGAARAYLDVAEDNAPARTLYEGAGFREVARRPAYYNSPDGTTVTGLVLVRDLGRR
jgi:ribosomal-protein-alanine N-acetyltransferase